MIRALLLALLGCGGSGLKDSDEAECVDHGECATGELCLQGQCTVVDCVSSDACALGSYCDPDAHTCTEGCLGEEDCLGGDTCDVDARTCVVGVCVDTEIDCAVGERCDDGACESVGKMCTECQRTSDCPTAREECLLDIDGNGHCYPECQVETDCPAGFDCLEIQTGPGQTQSFCIGECAWFTDQGLL
jgi:hypothetical protein